MATYTIDTQDPIHKGVAHQAKVWTKVFYRGNNKKYYENRLEEELNVRVQNPSKLDEHYGKIVALQNLIKQS